METMWKLANSRTGAWLGVALGLLLMAMVTVGQAASEAAKKGCRGAKAHSGPAIVSPPGGPRTVPGADRLPADESPGADHVSGDHRLPADPGKKATVNIARMADTPATQG